MKQHVITKEGLAVIWRQIKKLVQQQLKEATETLKSVFAEKSHKHSVTDITDMPAQASSTIDGIEGLRSALDSKASSSHTHAIADVNELETKLGEKADKASPAFTGEPTAPTAESTVNTDQVATTKFVQTVVSNKLDKAIKYKVVTE